MGDERPATGHYDGQEAAGKLLLETDELVFRGGFRLKVPFRDLTDVYAEGDTLHVGFGGKEAAFTIGPVARRWAERITNPPGLADKLGLKPGQRVATVGALPGEVTAALEQAAVDRGAARPRKGEDLIFLAVDRATDLRRVATLARHLAPDGALWTVRRKGSPDITEAAVLTTGRQAGLVDVKVARVSATHTAEKFVIPRAKRGR